MADQVDLKDAFIFVFRAECSIVESVKNIAGGIPLKKGVSPVRFVFGSKDNESYSCKIVGDEGEIHYGRSGVLLIELITMVPLDLKEGSPFKLISASFRPYVEGRIIEMLRCETKK